MRMTRILPTLGIVTAAWWLAAPSQANAQGRAPRSPAGVPATAGYANPIPAGGSAYTSPYANPFTNPGFNPYLNPYMTTVPMDPNLGLLYLMGAQSASGGLGSGRLSGVRGAEEGTNRRQPASVPPTMGRRPESSARTRGPARMPRSMGSPTTGAEPYFQRLPDRGGAAADYYGRSVRRTPQP